MLKKFSKRRVVAARLDSYHRGYHVGFRCGNQKGKPSKPEKIIRKVGVSNASKKVAMAAKLGAYQKGYQLGVKSGARQEEAQHTKISQIEEKDYKARNGKRSKACRKRVVAERLDAYLHGVQAGSQQKSVKQGRPVSKGSSVQFLAHERRRLRVKTSPDALCKASDMESLDLPAPSTPVRGASRAQSLPVAVQGPFQVVSAGSAPSIASIIAMLECPTPLRTSSSRIVCSEAINIKQPVGARQMQGDLLEEGEDLPKQSGVPLLREPPMATPSSNADALRVFLKDAAGLTSKPAAFQLCCKQKLATTEVGRLLQFEGQAASAARKVVFIVGGKCKLWKLNQIIAEFFSASQDEFVYEANKGAAVLGSHFMVSRPLAPGRCSSVPICSSGSAAHLDSASAFVDDRSCNVAQLFRGTSTRYALQQNSAEADQHVVFDSPLLQGEVTVTLDGIMLDSYDSHNPFDKSRRHSNGRKPLPRVVGSSFLSSAEMEAKNFVMQGYKEGADSLVKFDPAFPAIQDYYRRSQRKPLFRKYGIDFDLNDGCHASIDEETDSEEDIGYCNAGDIE